VSIRILIIEDDASLGQMLELHFADQGFAARVAGDCATARRLFGQAAYDLVLLDQRLPDGLGIDLLDDLLALVPRQAVIMMTGEHDLELAIDAIKKGAAEFIHKPVQTEALQAVVDKTLEARRQGQPGAAPATGRSSAPPRELIGRSAAMLAVSKEVALSAASRASVLITGESGTGKEVIARLIHQHSGRNGPFVAVNCAAIVDSLLESELFGHEKGAFTGALSRKPGKFELAEGGTLFLDEVGELAPRLQAKLLRALQERVFERVGGTRSISSDARIVSATNRDLFTAAREGRFREDLIYRLNVVSIQLPPLRERREDIPLLTRALLERIGAGLDAPGLAVTEEAQQRLNARDWPGNVRELENVLTQAAVRARGARITPDLLDLSPPVQSGGAPREQAPDDSRVLRTLEQVEAEHIQQVLFHTAGHKGRTSRILGISRPALDRKIRKYGLQVPAR
jgi:DNA-binding NtrC family response regulator